MVIPGKYGSSGGRMFLRRLTALMAAGAMLASLLPTGVEAAESRLDRLTRAALAGDREATRNAAKIISKQGGRNFRDAARIRPLLRDEALRGSTAAANAYGTMLQYGIGGAARPGEAAGWYSRGGQSGNVSASKKAAISYALGWGVKRDTSRALRLLAGVPSGQRGHKMLEIAKALLDKSRAEPDLALAWLKRADRIDPKGLLNTADAYRRVVDIVPQRAPELAGWLQPLADKGNGRAALLLARYMETTGAAGQKTAAALYLRAAERGEEDAFEGLGRLVSIAEPAVAQEIRAFLETRAQQGAAGASTALAGFYLFQPDKAESGMDLGLQHLRAAADKGDPQAQYRFAMMLLGNTDGADRSELAKAYLVLAASRGNAEAGIAVAALGDKLPPAEAQKVIAAQSR